MRRVKEIDFTGRWDFVMIKFRPITGKGEKMRVTRIFLVLMGVVILLGCASTSKPVRKLTKPVDDTAAELVKVRELKSQGETVAVVSPADQRQLKITF